jgi:hypothetical protein
MEEEVKPTHVTQLTKIDQMLRIKYNLAFGVFRFTKYFF